MHNKFPCKQHANTLFQLKNEKQNTTKTTTRGERWRDGGRSALARGSAFPVRYGTATTAVEKNVHTAIPIYSNFTLNLYCIHITVECEYCVTLEVKQHKIHLWLE